MTDPIEVLLKFAFIAVLYLFLLWVARSALRDLSRPTGTSTPRNSGAEGAQILHSAAQDGDAASSARLVVEQGGGLRPGETFVVGAGITIGRAQGSEVRIDDTYAS